MTCRGKRGISPIIAAVLLVVIVVSLGAAFIAIVRNYVDEGAKQVTVDNEAIKCGREVSVDWVIVDGNYQICNATAEDDDMASLNFYLENTGTINVLSAQVRIIGGAGIFTNNSVLNATLNTGAIQIVNVTYDPEAVGPIRQVKVVPRISLPGIEGHAYCSDSGISVSYVPNNCSTYQ